MDSDTVGKYLAEMTKETIAAIVSPIASKIEDRQRLAELRDPETYQNYRNIIYARVHSVKPIWHRYEPKTLESFSCAQSWKYGLPIRFPVPTSKLLQKSGVMLS
jgi:hypothetical protein